MKFEFYHGTSDIYLDSIIKNGLGGINPNIEFKHLETLKYLFELAEKHLLDNKRYLRLRDTTRAMTLQKSIQVTYNGQVETLNFKHDGIYIALSEARAVSYASNNKYGSEIVTRSISLLTLLEQKGIDFNNSDLAIDRFKEFKTRTPKPIIIKILEVNEDRLDKEDGKTAKESLDFLRKIYHNLNEKEKFEFFQYCNFKILDPIPVDKLKFYSLEYESIFGKPDFKYKLTRFNVK